MVSQGADWREGRSENGAEIYQAAAELEKLFASIDSWYVDGVITIPSVQRRSSLGGDDEKTKPFPLSHAARRNLLVSIDHLHALRASLKMANALHTYAPFTLIRSSLEGAVSALWLLGPAQRQERITRHILASRQDDHDQSNMAQSIGEPATVPRTDWIDRLIRECRLERSRVYGAPPSFGTQAKAVDALMWEEGDNLGELTWRMCSGMAHGREWATLELLHRHFRGDIGEGLAEVRLTARMTDVSVLAQLAYTMLVEAKKLFEQRANPQY